MKTIFKNIELKVLAVITAIIFWFFVVGTENSIYIFPEEVPIKVFNLSQDLIVSDDLGSATLRLKVENSDVIKSLSAEQFQAYIDLENFGEGETEVSVEVTSKNPQVRVVKVEPSTIKTKIVKKAERVLSVDYELNGEPKEGYKVEEVQIETEQILVKGPKEVLNEIDTVLLSIDVEGEDSDFAKVFRVIVLDEQGNEITNVEPSEKEIEAAVTIKLQRGQKLVGVKPTIVGTPQGNVWIKYIHVEPSLVQVKGDIEALDMLDFLQTAEIDVSNITENTDYTVKIENVPEGVELLEDQEITVKIEVESYTEVSSLERATVTVPVIIKKFTSDQDGATVNPSSVTLVAEGEKEALEKLKKDMQIGLDITEYKRKNQEANISKTDFDLPEGVQIVSIEPGKVSVEW